MTSSALAITEYVLPYGKGGAAIAVSDGSTVVHLDMSQSADVPDGAQLLTSFLDEMEADPAIAKHLPSVRRKLAADTVSARGCERLSDLRLSKGMSQKEFAASLQTSQGRVSEIENRLQKPGEEMIRKMASVLGVDFNRLMAALANG